MKCIHYPKSYDARVACAVLDWNENQRRECLKILKIKPFENSKHKRVATKKIYPKKTFKWKDIVQKKLFEIRGWDSSRNEEE